MRSRNPYLAALLVVVGGTMLARHVKRLGRIPGFSPSG